MNRLHPLAVLVLALAACEVTGPQNDGGPFPDGGSVTRDAGSCSPTCSTCCIDGECKPAWSPLSLCKSDTTCAICSADQYCSQPHQWESFNHCVPRCDASCAGCCLDGVCVAGASTEACGSGGAICGQCNLESYCIDVGGGRHGCWWPTACYFPDAGVGGGCRDVESNNCQPGTEDSACGSGGWPCRHCDAGGCQGQRCVW